MENKMDERVRKILTEYNNSHGWSTDDDTLIETLLESDVVYEEQVDKWRWWYVYDYVTEIDGHYIRYEFAETTGDDSPDEAGWKFDPTTIELVTKKEKVGTIVYYQATDYET
jgi:hypothetical protein